jgi:hypothetical protein
LPTFEQRLLKEIPAKVLILGHNGTGKTGSLAALAANGYKLRIIDGDKGTATLFGLLTNPKYPYRKYMEEKGYSLKDAVSYIPLDVPMGNKSVDQHSIHKLLAPTSASAWLKIGDLLNEWKDGDVNYGNIKTWDNDTVLVLDSLTTVCDLAYYYVQVLRGQLGALDGGFIYQANVRNTQELLGRLLEIFRSDEIRCNIVVLGHIEWVDDTNGVSRRPQVLHDEKGAETGVSPATGYPKSISRPFSTTIGMYFNDIYSIRKIGSGSNVRRTICTTTVDGVLAKTSNYLDKEYPIETGLASIFADLKQKKLADDFIRKISGK